MKDIRIITDSSCDLITDSYVGTLPNVLQLPYYVNRSNEDDYYFDDGRISRRIAFDYFENDIHWNAYPPTEYDLMSIVFKGDYQYLYLPSIGGPDLKAKDLTTIYTGLTSGALGLLIHDLQRLIDLYDASLEDLCEYAKQNYKLYKMILVPNPQYDNYIKVINSRKSKLYTFFEYNPIYLFDSDTISVIKGYRTREDLEKKLINIIDKEIDENGVTSLNLLHSFRENDQVENFFDKLYDRDNDVTCGSMEQKKLSLTNTAKYGHNSIELAYKKGFHAPIGKM